MARGPRRSVGQGGAFCHGMDASNEPRIQRPGLLELGMRFVACDSPTGDSTSLGAGPPPLEEWGLLSCFCAGFLWGRGIAGSHSKAAASSGVGHLWRAGVGWGPTLACPQPFREVSPHLAAVTFHTAGARELKWFRPTDTIASIIYFRRRLIFACENLTLGV